MQYIGKERVRERERKKERKKERERGREKERERGGGGKARNKKTHRDNEIVYFQMYGMRNGC